MSRNRDAEHSPWPSASAEAESDPAIFSPSATRDDAVALLRLAGLEAELDRLRHSMAALLEPLERQRSDLAALAELIEKDGAQGTAPESREILEARRRRLLRNQRTHADLARTLKRDETEVLAMSCELQRKTVRLAEEGDAVLARVSPPLRERYEAAVRKGQQPALVGVHEGRCPGCGKALSDASRRLVEEGLRVVPCAGCLRLLYDRGWTERDLMPPTLRPVTKAKP
jgi:hypothetical protein